MTGFHPDDDAISAHLDGADPELLTHLRECGPCLARLEAMRAVVRAVAAPPASPPAPLVERAIQAAIAVAAEPPVEDGRPQRASADRDPATQSQASAAAVSRRRRRRMPPPAWIAVAAAAVAVLVAVPALLGNGRPADEVATVKDNSRAETTAGAGAPGAFTALAPDLGDHSDPATVVSLISAAVNPSVASVAGDRAETTASPPPGAGPARAMARLDQGASASGAPPCFGEAMAAGQGRLGALVYLATARWKGVPAMVLVFSLDDATDPARHAYIMDAVTCALLVERRF